MSYEQFVGRSGPESVAQDEVNLPMIRHWVEAMGDANPVYLDEDAARGTGRDGVVAPPTMLQAWTMRGYAGSQAPAPSGDALGELWSALAADGFTSVVATDCEQEYLRELVPGDRISTTETVEGISPQKRTALGTGHFVTTVKTYRDQHGETVAVQRWRTLRFRPGTGADGGTTEPAGLRPRPAVNRDNAFWFDAAREHRLVIQRCTACGALRHPPAPCCPACRSFDWDTVEASGHGEIYSFVVNHHPQAPGFDYPLPVVLVELDEGVRLLANVVGLERERLEIGLPVRLAWFDADAELSLPAFTAAAEED